MTSSEPSTTLTTEISQVMDQQSSTAVPEWKSNVKHLVYLEDYDGIIEPDVVPVEIPECVIDENTPSVYQCIKCGNKQSNRDDIFRMRCTRCYNKAFNKIRPTKWVKFKAY